MTALLDHSATLPLMTALLKQNRKKKKTASGIKSAIPNISCYQSLQDLFFAQCLLFSIINFFMFMSSFYFIYFYQLEANYFIVLQWFLSYIDMNRPWIYMYSPSRFPLPPPSLPDASGSSQCTRPEHLSHASKLGYFIHTENLKEESKIIHYSKRVSIKIQRISLLSFFHEYFTIIMFVYYM